MRIPEFVRRPSVFAVLCLAVCLGACATTSGSRVDAAVQARAQARWDALLADDVEKAYSYFTPGYRSALSLTSYYRRLAVMRLKYTGARVTGSDCLENTCKVSISVDYSVFGAVPGVDRVDTTTILHEDWLFTGGDWYFLPKN